jgi:hypothetical protein
MNKLRFFLYLTGPICAGWLSIAIIVCFTGGSAVADDSVKLVIGFESRSTRLTAADTVGLDRLAATLESQPDNRLVVLVPYSRNEIIRHFIASRFSVVERELLKRGISGESVKIPQSEDDDSAIVLCIVPRTLPNTPLEILSSLALPSLQVVEPQSQAKNDPPSVPVSLIPGEDGGKRAISVVMEDVAAIPLRDRDAPQQNSSTSDGQPKAKNPDIEDLWVAPVGQSLQAVLKDWGGRAGWTVVWRSDREYPVDASATFSGEFTKVASQLFDGFATAIPAPAAHFYKGNRVLLVESGEGR